MSERALIVEGGAMRTIFACGVLDTFIGRSFKPFSSAIGVSAGAVNLAAFLSGVPGRVLPLCLANANRPEFKSLRRSLLGGDFLDLHWLLKTLKENDTYDPVAINASGCRLTIVTADIDNAVPNYISPDVHSIDQALVASCSLPGLCRHFPQLDGVRMADGGISDPLPVQAAIQSGARDIMVIRSRPATFSKQRSKLDSVIEWKFRQYPGLVRLLKDRVDRHHEARALIDNPPDGVRIVQVAPPLNYPVRRLEARPERLRSGYSAGIQAAYSAIDEWNAYSGPYGRIRAAARPA